MNYNDYFSGKRITLMGLGLLGRGIGDTRFLAECGAQLIVTDLKTEEALKDSLEQLKEFPNITYRLGMHDLGDFKDRDLIIKAAGVPLDSPFIAEAKKNGIPVRMSADLFMELSGVATVGITGTRGKSTTTHMIAHILNTAGKRIVLGGNVRGVSTLALLPEVTPDTIAVLELDSWQCQGLGEGKISPHIAVFTNLMSDHLNYYGGDMEKYFADKANIFKFQKAGDCLFVGAQIAEKVLAADPFIAPVVPKDIPVDWKLKVLGEHNRKNASLAADAARALGVGEEKIKEALESFEPVEGRLQFVREVRGIQIYNDNNATTPDATIAALKAFEGKEVVLIAGGADKNLDLTQLALEVGKCKTMVLLPGTGTERFKSLLQSPLEASTMQEAVHTAMMQAQSGDVVLLSPAFASFGLFKNEYDRNDQFVKAAEGLK